MTFKPAKLPEGKQEEKEAVMKVISDLIDGYESSTDAVASVTHIVQILLDKWDAEAKFAASLNRPRIIKKQELDMMP